MQPIVDPWDALDRLEFHDGAPDFESSLRGFFRDCSLRLLPVLPPEAAAWVVTADEFEAGRLNVDELTAARVRAIQFHDDRRETAPRAMLSGLRAVMYRLWPPRNYEWHEAAWHFLHFVKEAGLHESEWWPLLRARFPRALGGAPDAEAGVPIADSGDALQA